MQTDNSIPYPRPDYSDGDLLSRELVNGTFALGMMADVQEFRPPLDRYNVTEDKLTNMSLLRGNITPQSYDITMRDVTLDGVKELGWQPAKRIDNPPEPEIVFNPLRHYSFVEWVGINSTELGNIESNNNVSYVINVGYYDDENAGLFGFQTIKDDDGNVTDKFAVFYSLKELSLAVLGRLPDGYNLNASAYVGYVQGAYIIHFHDGGYVSFGLDGSVSILSGYSNYYTPLGDDGCIAIEGTISGKTYIFQKDLTQEDPILDTLDERYCVRGGGFSSSPTKYLFGTKIGSAYFFLRDNESSYKFKHTKLGWKAKIIENRIWAYGKRLKYDYVTDNWLHHPLKTLKYNMIKNGIFVRNGLPKHDEDDEVLFPNSDMHGDFCRINKADGSREYYHTFNFRSWKPLTGEATNYLYGCTGRLWTNDRVDGVAGLMPYTIVVKSVSDYVGGKKTVLQFSGFIFRGGE